MDSPKSIILLSLYYIKIIIIISKIQINSCLNKSMTNKFEIKFIMIKIIIIIFPKGKEHTYLSYWNSQPKII